MTSGSADDVLTEENLSRYYGARVRVVRDQGTIVVVPLRSSVETDELDRNRVVLDDVHADVDAEARSGRHG